MTNKIRIRLSRWISQIILDYIRNPKFIILGVKLGAYSNFYAGSITKDQKHAINTLLKNYNIRKIRISGSGILILISEREVIYFPISSLGVKTISQSQQAWKEIKQSYISKIIPNYLEIYFINNQRAWVTEKLNHKPEKLVSAKYKIFNLLQAEGKRAKPSKILVQKWIEALLYLNNDICLEKWILRIQELSSLYWQIGPRHGDLTPRNFMFRGDQPVLIDLDRFSWESFQVFDLIHFTVEDYSKQKQTDWFTYLIELYSKRESAKVEFLNSAFELEKKSSKDLLDLYILERLQLEIHKDITPPSQWIVSAHNLIKFRECTF